MDSIEIKGRKFKFRTPTAFDGCAVFNMLTTYEAPFGISNVIGLKFAKRAMSPAELETFLRLCLKNCYEDIPDPGKPAPVVDEDGGIGINDGTAPLLTKIAAQYIIFFIGYWQRESD